MVPEAFTFQLVDYEELKNPGRILVRVPDGAKPPVCSQFLCVSKTERQQPEANGGMGKAPSRLSRVSLQKGAFL